LCFYEGRVYFVGAKMGQFLRDERGGMGLGVFVGFLLMLLIGWVPVLGPLLAGVVAGILAQGGVGKGALAGFLSGVMAAIILGLLVAFWSLVKLGPLEAILGGLATFWVALILSAGAALFGLIGGIIGGAMVEKR
jgi:hypothetical protein